MTEMFFWIGACGLPGEDWKPVMAVEYLPGLEEIQLSVDYRGATLLIPED